MTTKTKHRTRVNVWIDDDILFDLRAFSEQHHIPLATALRMRLRGIEVTSKKAA